MNTFKTTILAVSIGLISSSYAQDYSSNRLPIKNLSVSSSEITPFEPFTVNFEAPVETGYEFQDYTYNDRHIITSPIREINFTVVVPDFTYKKHPGITLIGPRDFGKYEYEISTEEDSDISTFTINVVEKGTKKTVNDISGTWFDPNFSGAGFSVIQAANGLVFYYYGYADNGERLWLVSDVVDTTITKGQAITANMYESADNNGANFTTKPTTEQSGVTDWGTIEFNVASCDAATAKLTGTDGDLALNLIKLANNQNAKCYD